MNNLHHYLISTSPYYNNKRIQSKKDAPCKIQGGIYVFEQVNTIHPEKSMHSTKQETT